MSHMPATEEIGGSAVSDSRTITAGVGLSGGGDLSADRTISLANTAVTPGDYTAANITVDAQGRLTAASSSTPAVVFSDVDEHPSIDPTSPNALDDEFNGTALDAKWVAVSGGSSVSATVANSSVVITAPYTADRVYGYTQAYAPGSSAFTIEARINVARLMYSATVFSSIGVGVTDGTRYAFGGVMSDGGNERLGIQYWSDTSTFVNDSKSNLLMPTFTRVITNGYPYALDLWIRLARSGSDLTVSYSPNGYDFGNATTYSNVLSGWGALTRVGMLGQIAGGGTTTISPRFFYFRKIA